jgi:hypothetical protein
MAELHALAVTEEHRSECMYLGSYATNDNVGCCYENSGTKFLYVRSSTLAKEGHESQNSYSYLRSYFPRNTSEVVSFTIFIVRSVSSIVCVVLCAVFCLSVVCYFV